MSELGSRQTAATTWKLEPEPCHCKDRSNAISCRERPCKCYTKQGRQFVLVPLIIQWWAGEDDLSRCATAAADCVKWRWQLCIHQSTSSRLHTGLRAPIRLFVSHLLWIVAAGNVLSTGKNCNETCGKLHRRKRSIIYISLMTSSSKFNI